MSPRLPKAPKPPKIPKPKPAEIIRRLISGQNFSGKPSEWAREGRVLKQLRARIVDDGFWRVVTFSFKPDSMTFFLGTRGLEMLDQRYKNTNTFRHPSQNRRSSGRSFHQSKLWCRASISSIC